MFTSISFSLEFDEINFGIVLHSFCLTFSFFSMIFDSSLHSYCTVHLIALKRLLFERFFSLLSLVKNRLELSFLVHILQYFLSQKKFKKMCTVKKIGENLKAL